MLQNRNRGVLWFFGDRRLKFFLSLYRHNVLVSFSKFFVHLYSFDLVWWLLWSVKLEVNFLFEFLNFLFHIFNFFLSGSQPDSYRVDFTNLNTDASNYMTTLKESALLAGLDAGAKYSLTVTPMLKKVAGKKSDRIEVSPGEWVFCCSYKT